MTGLRAASDRDGLDRPIDQLRGHRDHASRSSDASRSEVPEVITVCGCAVRRKICDLLKSDVVRFLELTHRIPTHVPVVRGGRSADRRGAPRRRAARGRATDKVLPRGYGEAVGWLGDTVRDAPLVRRCQRFRFQRAWAAARAIARRLCGVRTAALAGPPFKPPNRPSAAA